MPKPADSDQIAKARALKVVKDLDLTHRGYMGEEYFANELVAFAASERQAVKEDCCRAVCDCCGKYAQYWHPAELLNQRWRHLSTKVPDEGKPTTHLCDAAAIRSME